MSSPRWLGPTLLVIGGFLGCSVLAAGVASVDVRRDPCVTVVAVPGVACDDRAELVVRGGVGVCSCLDAGADR